MLKPFCERVCKVSVSYPELQGTAATWGFEERCHPGDVMKPPAKTGKVQGQHVAKPRETHPPGRSISACTV